MALLPQPDPNANDLDACRRKVAYSYRDAHLRTGELRHERGIIVKPYKCPCCLHWHLTKMGAGK